MRNPNEILSQTLSELRHCRTEIDDVMTRLEELAAGVQKKRTYQRRTPVTQLDAPAARTRRTMSAATRKRMKLAMKRRWAQAKKSGQNSLQAVAG